MRRKFVQSSSSKEYDSGKLPKQKGPVCSTNTSLESGLCSIEFYMAAKDPFRVAPGDKIPVPWPYVSRKPSVVAREIADNLRQDCEGVLAAFDIKLRDFRVWGLAPTRDHQARDTLILNTDGEDPQSWKEAATIIQKMLNDATSRRASGVEIRVEIRNNTLMYQDISSIIEPNSLAHKVFMEVENTVTEQVMKSCPGQWRAISYHMRGVPFRKDPQPTIMIRISPGTHNYWGVIESEIMAAVEAASSFKTQIHIEMLPGRALPLISQDMAPAEPIIIRRILEMPLNGASIGARGATEAGTLGAWVEFRPPGNAKKERCFLTCYQVISPGDTANKDFNDQHGIGLEGRQIKVPIRVDYPAPFDATTTKNYLQLEITQGDDKDGRRALAINGINKHISAGGIGFVIHASGRFRQNQNGRRMDWALVRAHRSASSQCNKPAPATFSPGQLLNGRLEYEVATDEVISKMSSLSEGDWVAKVGRSGTTTGEVNAMQSTVDWANGERSKEIEIAGVGSAAMRGAPFAEPGDSGSMVINLQKEWVGMLIGRLSGEDFGLVTSTRELMDDITAKTGGTISLV